MADKPTLNLQHNGFSTNPVKVGGNNVCTVDITATAWGSGSDDSSTGAVVELQWSIDEDEANWSSFYPRRLFDRKHTDIVNFDVSGVRLIRLQVVYAPTGSTPADQKADFDITVGTGVARQPQREYKVLYAGSPLHASNSFSTPWVIGPLPGEQMHIEHLYVFNDGSTETYDIYMEKPKTTSANTYFYKTVSIGSDETDVYDVDWYLDGPATFSTDNFDQYPFTRGLWVEASAGPSNVKVTAFGTVLW